MTSEFERFKDLINRISSKQLEKREQERRNSEEELRAQRESAEFEYRWHDEASEKVKIVVRASNIENIFERINQEFLSGKGDVVKQKLAFSPMISTPGFVQGGGPYGKDSVAGSVSPKRYSQELHLDCMNPNLILLFRASFIDGSEFPNSSLTGLYYDGRKRTTKSDAPWGMRKTYDLGRSIGVYEFKVANDGQTDIKNRQYLYSSINKPWDDRGLSIDGAGSAGVVNIRDLALVLERESSKMIYIGLCRIKGVEPDI